MTNISKRLVSLFEDEKYNELSELADQYLNDCNENKVDASNIIMYQINILKGHIEIENKNLEKAKFFLNESIKFKSSAPLKTFGPNMSLAKELLKLGEAEIVLNYIKEMKKVWYLPFRLYYARNWESEIIRNEIPSFGANEIYYISNH